MTCVSCGNTAEVLVDTGILPSGDAVLRCARCGLDFLEPAATDDYWETAGQESIYDDEAVHRERSEFFDSVLASCERLVAKGTLLDVGAGRGEFADRAASRGWSVSCVEPSERAAAVLADSGYANVYRCPLEDVPNDTRYDCVALLDILEHTRNPSGTLQKATGLLRPGGVLVMLTPDGGSAFRRLALAAARVSRGATGLLKYQYYRPHVSYVSEKWVRTSAAGSNLEILSISRPATPRRFLMAKLKHHYSHYGGNSLFSAAVGVLYPLSRVLPGNKLLVFARKAR